MNISPLHIGVFACVIAVFTCIAFRAGAALGAARKEGEWKGRLQKIRREIADSSRSIIRGQVSEQLAPYLPGFPFDPSSCTFVGKPVDFIVFHRLDDPDERALVFVEVKTGSAKLNKNEEHLRDAIKKGRVYYYEYRPDIGVYQKNETTQTGAFR